MSKELPLFSQEIENRIFTIRGLQVMIDRDLAELYQTETKYINRAGKRNPDRFPSNFMFQLDKSEWAFLQNQIEIEHDPKRHTK
jgi:hypothetical protein